MTHKQQDDFDLDALFASEKRQEQGPSDALMAAIMQDACDVHARRAKPLPAVKPSRWKSVLNELGGWQAMAAFAACACFGVYMGYASPSTVIDGIQSGASAFDITDSFSVDAEFELSWLEG